MTGVLSACILRRLGSGVVVITWVPTGLIRVRWSWPVRPGLGLFRCLGHGLMPFTVIISYKYPALHCSYNTAVAIPCTAVTSFINEGLF